MIGTVHKIQYLTQQAAACNKKSALDFMYDRRRRSFGCNVPMDVLDQYCEMITGKTKQIRIKHTGK